MTTGNPHQSSIDFDALEDAFEISPRNRPPAVEKVGLGGATRSYLSAALQLPRWSLPGSSSSIEACLRTAKTAGPFVIADLISVIIAGIAAQLLNREVFPTTYQIGWTAPAALLLLLVCFWLGGLYGEIWIHPVVELRQIVALNSTVFVAIAVGRLTSLPLLMWCGTCWLLALVLVPLARVLLRHGLGRFAWWGYPTLIIGSGDGADELAKSLLKTRHCSLRPCLMTDPDGACRFGSLPVVNDPETLESLLRAKSIRHAVFSLPQFSSIRQQAMLDHYGKLLPHMLVLSDTNTMPALWGASQNSGRLSGFEVRNGRLVATMQLIKRTTDVLVALAVLPIFAILTVILLIIGFLTGNRPLFYSHERIGQHGRLVNVWKFRTMHVDAERLLEEHLAANPEARVEWELQHKLRDDPRVTPIGRFMRSTSLDELPQIWNVLKGDMSLVGPRPIVEAEVPRYGNAIELYAAVKPGITGLWQVSGRTNIGYDERVELDVFYIRHWSPWLDLYILAKTIVTLAGRSGAY